MPVSVNAIEPCSGSLHVDRGQALLTVVGEIDAATVERFRALVEAAVAISVTGVTLDLSGVDFLGLCAVPVLESASHALATTGRRVTVRHLPPVGVRLFQLTKLTEKIDVEAADPEDDLVVVRGLVAGAGIPAQRQVLDAALKLVVTMAQAVVVGADGVSITLPRHGRLGTVAASNGVVLDMDHDQYDTAQGPCLDAAEQGERFHIDSLESETRWPDFVPRARARGIESILSTPLTSAKRPIGALNIYSRTSRAFAEHEQQWADQFAEEASVVVATAEADGPGAPFDTRLMQALRSRQTIAVAQGIVLHRDGGSPETAYASLREQSRRTSRPLLDLCHDLAAAAGSGGAPS